MKSLLFACSLLLMLSACNQKEYHLQYKHTNLLLIDAVDMPLLEIQQDVYVPAYSDIYYETEDKKTFLTVILSLRNISFEDTVYFDKIDYYGSNGKLIKEYLDRVLVLRPMESMEYIVEAAEKQGGAGANFVVRYNAAEDIKNHPFIETVMMGNLDNYRFAFSSPGIPINK